VLRVLSHASFLDVFQPEIFIVASLFLLVYLGAAYGPLRRLYKKPGSVIASRWVSFTVGCVVLYLSFGGPLDYLSDNFLFSAHMLQHMIEILLMTPLLMYGTPYWMVEPIVQLPFLRRLFTVWLNPIVSAVVFNVILNLFHLPALYDLALANDPFHLFEHFCFFVISIFLWGAYRRLSAGKRLLFLLLSYNLMMPLVIFMIIARYPWYTYYTHQPRLYIWLTPLGDQQLGAIIMAVTMMGVYLYLGISSFLKQDESIWYD
jgi:putative membrane protein